MIDGVHDVLARQALVVDIVTHLPMDLRGDDDVLTLHSEMAEQITSDLLAFTHRIDIRGVEKVDSRLQRPLDKGFGLLLIQHPFAPALGSIAHHSQAQARDLHSGFAEVNVLHGSS